MVRARSMKAVLRRRNLITTDAAQPKRKAAQFKRKAASSPEELKRMAASAVDVDKILRLKKEAMEAIETKCFPLSAKARLPAAAAAGEAQPSGSGAVKEEKIPEKKKRKKVVKYLVSQAYIDHLKAGLFHCVDEVPEDELATESQLFRDGYRAKVLLTEKLRACQQVLLDQYDAFGFAYDAKEVTDDEGED